MTSFIDYYKSLPKIATPVAAQSAAPTFDPSKAHFAASDKPQDFLSWLGDIISRPLYGATNAINDTVNAAIAQGKGQSPLDTFKQNPLGPAGSFLSGMFSTNPKVHQSTSDLIEGTTDKLGALNPDYKNTANNVNPVLKGIAGFVGDVALDPLTYVPGPDIITWGKKLKALPEIIKGIEDSGKTADKAVSTATKMEAPTKQTVVNSILSKLPKPTLPEQLDLDSIKYIAGKDRTPNQAGIAAVADALASPAASTARSALHGLSGVELHDAAKAVADVRNAKPLTFDEWRGELTSKFENSDKPLSQMPKLTVVRQGKRVDVPMPKALAEFESPTGGDKFINAALQKRHQQYLQHFSTNQAQGRLVDSLGQHIKPTQPVEQSAVHTVANSLAGFQERLARDEQNVRAQFGDPLVDTLKRYSDPAKFERTVQKMSAILDGSTDIHTLKRLDAPTRRLMQHLGVEPDKIPLGVRKISRQFRQPDKPVLDYPVEATPEEAAAAAEVGKGLTKPQIVADNALRPTLDREILHPLDPASSAGREFNGYSTYTLSKNIKQQAAKLVAKLGAGPRANAYRGIYMPALRISERVLDEHGIPSYIGVGNDRVQLYLSQILDHLHNVDPKRMDLSYWNGGTAVPETNLMDAVVAAVHGGVDLPDATGKIVRAEGPGAVDAALRQTSTRSGQMENNLLHPKRFGTMKNLSGDKLVSSLADLIRQEAPAFRTMAEDNAKTWSELSKKDFYNLTDQGLKELRDNIEQASGIGDLVRNITDISSRVKANGAVLGAPQTAIDNAYHAVEGTVDPILSDTAHSYQKQASAVATAQRAGKGDVQAIKNQNAFHRFRALNDALNRTIAFQGGGPTVDIGDTIDRAINAGLLAKVRTLFSTHMGMEDLHDLTLRTGSALTMTVRDFSESLAKLQKKAALPTDGGPEGDLAMAFSAIQRGVTPTIPRQAELAAELKPLVMQVLGGDDLTKASVMDNAFTREGIDVDHANQIISKHAPRGDAEKYLLDEDKALQDAQKLGITPDEALAQQWRQLKIDDPIDYLSRMHAGFSAAAAHQTLTNEFLMMAHDLNAISKVPRKGFVQLVDDSGKSILGKYLPKDIYLHQDIARQMHVVDTVLRDSFDHNSEMGKFIDNYYRPLLDMWKWAMTLPNPTHQIRNLVGDQSLTYLANGSKNYLKAHKLALQAMAHKEYDGFDAVAALQGIKQIPENGKALISGRLGDLTGQGIYNTARDRGILPTFQQAEQLETDLMGTSALSKTWKGLTKSKVGRKVGGVSEARDHYVRLGHYTQFVMNHMNSTKYKDMNSLLDAAAEATRKWHPDGSDLTKFERNLKLVIPFYSWTRKAIPLIIESTLLHPARVNAFNKASYNLAVTMGVNPQSLSNPFPSDQMFPSYLTDQAFGPQFKIDNKYLATDFAGVPTWQVLDSTVAGNPLQNVLGQMAPFIKAPFEVATGKNLGTGSDIHDWSDYIDSQIPGIAQASRMTGFSPTGSVYGLLSGQGAQQQYQVAKGNKDPSISVINYLTGAGLTPMSNANQISYARLQNQNTARGSGVGF